MTVDRHALDSATDHAKRAWVGYVARVTGLDTPFVEASADVLLDFGRAQGRADLAEELLQEMKGTS